MTQNASASTVAPASFESRRAALALMEAMIPGAPGIPGADEESLRAVEEAAAHLSPKAVPALRAAVQALDAATVLSKGRPFHALDAAAQDDMLQRWSRDPVLRGPTSLLALAFKLVHFDREPVYGRMGGKLNVVRDLERPRWLAQVTTGDDWPEGEPVVCDVVVVGTGAGGAVVGRELAEKGYAVCFVEEGDYHRRDSFTGSSMRAHQLFYRSGIAVGNAPMPVFMGRMVGGSTAVNGGTCFRPPSWVMDRWCDTLRSDDFAPTHLEGYFRRVEAMLQVAPTEERYLGAPWALFRRGAKALGWHHARINRNTPGCVGSGFCDFGCRTDARRSTNVSYIPAALERGAMLLTGLRAERVRIDNGRAQGLDAVTKSGRRVRVSAKAVILAGGAVPTPMFLMKQGICNASGQLGRNLTLHPSGGISGLFDEPVKGKDYVPQGSYTEQFLREGILITSAQTDTNYAPMVFPMVGRLLMDTISRLDHIATLAALIADDARGTVRLEADGNVFMSYNLTEKDVRTVHQGMVRSAELLLAAGATKLYPAITSTPVMGRDDLHRLAKMTPSASDIPLVSYHPLGTCRMGRDPRESVVDLDHQTHDVKRLFVVDGSTVQGPLGVNPQLTIMTLATRAADRIADVLG